MSKNYYAKTASTEPTLFITKGRQRVKQYDGNIIYLKDGDEFELEIFNPKSSKILAKIRLNGKYLSSGIVLRPGERVFLERYLDEAKKFKFETYEINANDLRARDAIAYNGNVEVEFYDEYIQPAQCTITYNWPWYEEHHHHHHYYHQKPVTPTWTYTSSGTVPMSSDQLYSSLGSSGSLNIGSVNSAYCCTGDVNNVKSADTPIAQPIETGIVDKGSNSEQNLSTDYTSFNSWFFSKISWKILPESNRAYVKEDLTIYCVNCGAKRKKTSHKFCPNCGTRFS